MRKLIIIAFAIAAFGLFSAMNGFSQKGHTFRKGYKISKIKANPEKVFLTDLSAIWSGL